MSELDIGFSFLFAQTSTSLAAIFWYLLLFDVPRYILPFAVAALTLRSASSHDRPAPASPSTTLPSISIVLIGHNEADSISACVRSLREQSISGFEIIIVSDGSTDGMSKVAREMVRNGHATCILSTGVRGGKASGTNLACEIARGDIIINIDCDCSFDRYAIERLVKPFEDEAIGAACGDIAPRNAHASIVAQFQEIEYLEAISVGKRFSAAIEQVTCASGAFSAFRRKALARVGGLDVGGGEDLDVTLRLRRAGWRIAYVPDAICYTDVPSSVYNYIRQRLRWERDAVWIRFRKHRRLLNPLDPQFRPLEALHQWDFLLFNVVGAAIFPIYLVWLVFNLGALAIPILMALHTALFVLDALMLAFASWTTGRAAFWRNLPFLPGYSIFMAYLMRSVRLIAYIDEWFLSGSHRDNYTPAKVRYERAW
ncbi:glycosyltransferase [Chelativorans salis]|uniref:Glycosyltransferase family 2 protein n=1 Tax=Chelativorans salis TaxID=2978478 RepID=A0ABT2LW63_9HYPH|nr:glycosyltransferase [Chelativorans sp. EGI FJ00035]MCT7378344.1 glycosyltransferase family 2 protein [Chelativorans sp. EGI FJ00035]